MPAKPPAIPPAAAAALQGLGAALREQRRALKLSAAAAAEAAGLSRVTLHRVEKGEPNVAAAAYAAVAVVVGLTVEAAEPRRAQQPASLPSWIPVRIPISRFPKLRQLAWHVQGSDELTPREALDIYERNWRHVDVDSLSDEERKLVDALRAALAA